MPRRLLTTIALLLMLAGISQQALAGPGAPSLASSARAIEPPDVTAQAVFSFDLTTGITLYEKNPHERMQVGSTVKIATALVVMKYGNPSDQVLITEEDTVDIAVYSNMQLQAGDTLTVGTLLYGLLIPSGNDAALALARHVGMQICECEDRTDAISAFVGAMNDIAKGLGLENTRFTRPDGLDSKQAYSTAHDMARLFGEFMKDERLRGISAEPAYQFTSAGPEKRQYAEDNTNRLLGREGVIAGKTGTTPEAGACVVLAREVNGGSNTVITAVFGSDVQYQGDVQVEGSDKRWDDAQAVFAAMDEQFAWVTPGAEGTFPGLAEEMAIWQVEFQDPPSIPYPRDGVDAAYQLVLKPDAGEGSDGGSVRLYYNKEQVGSVPVYYKSASTVREHG
jgi:D-alanyl-D-alanine carboxypeptidase (penicillin-binding protein 5/6)